MEDAPAIRERARATVADVVPDALRSELLTFVDGGSAIPGVLVVRCARTVNTDVDFDVVADRAVGVQLVYEGLRLTRRLVHEPPWAVEEDEGDDLAILAADILVARGAYLLADTEAAEPGVDVIRGFGRDQTMRRAADDPGVYDRRLEADVFELAAIAGTTALGPWPSGSMRTRMRDLAETLDGDRLPTVDALPDDLFVDPVAPNPTADDTRVHYSTDGNG